MDKSKLHRELIQAVVSAAVGGSASTEYRVRFTAESVCLLFGTVTKTHRDALFELIAIQTEGHWRESPELAAMAGATAAIGIPEAVDRLKARISVALEEAGLR